MQVSNNGSSKPTIYFFGFQPSYRQYPSAVGKDEALIVTHVISVFVFYTLRDN